MKNTFYLLLFWLGLSLEVPAQAIWSADFPFAGELPSNEMTELYQDEDGFVWIGTTNGLSRRRLMESSFQGDMDEYFKSYDRKRLESRKPQWQISCLFD